ncbi:MAG TPA: polyhydroxyalkanoate biosynthesis repressor PhaR [Acidimicrobiaceae bacterium]|nr:polyhydroxyalkanoate biosynthesis repressor PhaR [Acidimicrobiaceae bacterium]
MAPSIELAGRLIGADHPPIVIAEIGINHGGDLGVALQMVDAAADAGVEVVKHQTHVVEDEMSSAAREVVPGNTEVSIYEVMASCALDEDEEASLKGHVEARGMTFLSTPFSRAAADRLERLSVSAYKIGSGECNNLPLLRHVASFGKPVVMSTGINTVESVARSVSVFDQASVPVALLHTTNLYPTPPHLVRLGAMVEMANAFPKHVIGLSDHTLDNVACLGAVALGASILERHFTDHRDREGPDIVCSMDRDDCAALVRDSKTLHQALGGSKGPIPEEKVTMDFAFATVVTIRPIAEGEVFSHENLWVKRPGTGGIPAARFDELIGRRAARDLDLDVHLDDSDIVPSMEAFQ